MKKSEKKAMEKIAAAKDYLALAVEQIEAISRDDRTTETDTLLNKAADEIFEAQEALKKIDEYQYYSTFVGEQIRPRMRHRKNK